MSAFSKSLVLFDQTDNYAITGGWTQGGSNTGIMLMEQAEGLMRIKHLETRTAREWWTYTANNKIDVTKLSKILIKYSTFFYNPDSAQSVKGSVIALRNRLDDAPDLDGSIIFKCADGLLNTNQTNLTLEFDLASYTGEYYFAVGGLASYGVRGNANNNYGLLWEIEKIVLE